MSLKISTRKVEGGVIVVDCAGRVVFGEEAAALRETVKGLLQEYKNIVLNLANVAYIDSGGLGTLVGLYTSAKSAGGAIKLLHLTHRTTELLQVTKLLTVFDTFDSEAAAIKSFTTRTAVA